VIGASCSTVSTFRHQNYKVLALTFQARAKVGENLFGDESGSRDSPLFGVAGGSRGGKAVASLFGEVSSFNAKSPSSTSALFGDAIEDDGLFKKAPQRHRPLSAARNAAAAKDIFTDINAPALTISDLDGPPPKSANEPQIHGNHHAPVESINSSERDRVNNAQPDATCVSSKDVHNDVNTAISLFAADRQGECSTSTGSSENRDQCATTEERVVTQSKPTIDDTPGTSDRLPRGASDVDAGTGIRNFIARFARIGKRTIGCIVDLYYCVFLLKINLLVALASHKLGTERS
jgi:hypothetical protein